MLAFGLLKNKAFETNNYREHVSSSLIVLKVGNLVLLFHELMSHDVFSHDAYMCSLISRGDLNNPLQNTKVSFILVISSRRDLNSTLQNKASMNNKFSIEIYYSHQRGYVVNM